MLQRITCLAIAVVASAGLPAAADPIGSAFTYQGRLESTGALVDGLAALRFRLYDAQTGGTQIGSTVDLVNVPVVDGLFTVNLDFGASAFGPDARWLAIEVRTTNPGVSCGSQACTLLTPRQRVAPAPVALYALNAPPATSHWTANATHIFNANAGNVGIGLTAPTTKFHARGATAGVATNTAQFDNPTIGSNASHVHFGTKGDWYIRSAANDGLGKVMIQDTPGSVCIGTDLPLGSKVAIAANNVIGLLVANSATNGQGIAVTANNGANAAAINATGPATTGWAGYFAGRMYVSGNLGLGTENPLWKLHMVAPQAVARLESTNTVNGSVIEMRNNTTTENVNVGAINFVDDTGATPGQLAYFDDEFTDSMTFRVAGAERMRVKGANVGIGTTVPAWKLHVNAGNEDAIFAGNTGNSPIPAVGQAALYGVGATGARGVSNLNNGNGVVGIANTGTNAWGVYGEAAGGGYAGWFNGRVNVTGNLSKGGGSFKIDHPLDPENKYLYHSFVESPDMMNIYNGNVVTDARGYATITLPDWFETLNRDFRYQLTVMDEDDSDAFVLAKVVRAVEGNQFTIRSSAPHASVSWQVTGIRQDPWAEANRIPVEENKPAHERGYYAHPEVYGLDASRNLVAAKAALTADAAGTAREADAASEAPDAEADRSPAPAPLGVQGSIGGR